MLNRQQRLMKVAARRQQGAVVLEDIHDLHNAAAVLRCCDAFGLHRVLFIFEHEKPFDPRNVGRSSSSTANKWLDYTIYRSTQECLAALKADGYQIIATVADRDAESLVSAELLTPKVAILLGNEHRGLSDRAVRMADRRLTVPMLGMVRSLNVSVTAGIVLYEIYRQRCRAGAERYHLPRETIERLKQDFLTR